LLKQSDRAEVSDYCSILDTLMMARERHPGQRNNLDALCKRYGVDNSGRDLHGALLDAEILADVYLTMTGGQTNLSLAGDGSEGDSNGRQQPSAIRRLPAERARTQVIQANAAELAEHVARLAIIEKSAGALPLWLQMEQPTVDA
jgi:DNA polymerase-3 subunit epsilon